MHKHFIANLPNLKDDHFIYNVEFRCKRLRKTSDDRKKAKAIYILANRKDTFAKYYDELLLTEPAINQTVVEVKTTIDSITFDISDLSEEIIHDNNINEHGFFKLSECLKYFFYRKTR